MTDASSPGRSLLSNDLDVVRRARGPVMTTLREFYKMGPGPSSSHTIGPMRIGLDFLARAAAMPAEVLSRATGLRAVLLGSLSATGRGHGTDRAALAGLLGMTPAACPPTFLDDLAAHPERVHEVRIGPVTLHVSMSDVVYRSADGVLPHPNTMRVALLAKAEALLEVEYYSVGGGFIEWAGYTPPDKGVPPHPYASMEELRRHVQDSGLTLPRVLLENECALTGEGERDVFHFLDEVADVMVGMVDAGLACEADTLPGPIGLHSKAAAVHRRALQSEYDADRAIGVVAALALAASEENSRGHIVVTAPTAGSAGVLPAIVKALREGRHASRQQIRDGLLAAAAIGYLCKHNATLSGAEGGCQAEIGVASAMGAALAAQVMGLGIRVIENAAESALEHHLGMTCDPVAGYVQVPCIERCAFGAIKAWTACMIAMNDIETKRRVDLDTCIAAMAMTARDMRSQYKETSEAGLAAFVVC
jgi:L-serine dehydratase